MRMLDWPSAVEQDMFKAFNNLRLVRKILTRSAVTAK